MIRVHSQTIATGPVMDEDEIERYYRSVNELDPEAPGFDEDPGFSVFDLWTDDADDE